MNLDPSFAGAAGGYSVASTVGDLSRFLDTLLAGRLFRHRATLKQMLTIAPAQGAQGAPSDASVNRDERREAALVSRRARSPTDVARRRTRFTCD